MGVSFFRLSLVLCYITVHNASPAQFQLDLNRTLNDGSEHQHEFAAAAERAVNTTASWAAKWNLPVSVAVVDQHGQLARFERSEGAWLSSVDVAIKKARTALLWNSSTTLLKRQSLPGGQMLMHEVSNGGQVFFGGGVPLSIGGFVVGAIGVSGGMVTQDAELAQAGKTAFEENNTIIQHSMSSDQALAAIEGAIEATFTEMCASKNLEGGPCNVSVAVVDSGGLLMEFARMDDAWLGSVDVALKKAKSAALWCVGSSNSTHSAGYGFSKRSVLAASGGIALVDMKGRCIGGIGVGGGAPEADHYVAMAGHRGVSDGAKPLNLLNVMTIGSRLKIALKGVRAAVATSERMGRYVTAVVVDAGGSLVAFSRNEKAVKGSSDDALKKANAAAMFGMSTTSLAKITDPEKNGDMTRSLRSLELTNGGIVTGPGGEPVKDATGRVVFGVGVSGGKADGDTAGVRAATDEIGNVQSVSVISEFLADKIVQKAIDFASLPSRSRGPFSFCVVDRFFGTVKFHRQIGAHTGSVDLACKKAKTSVMFQMPTEELGNSFHGLEISNNFISPGELIAVNSFSAGVQLSGLVTFGGGLPLIKDGDLLGGFGVAGSTVPEDIEVCAVGAEALHFEQKL